jgi:hypothetical protein
MSQPSNGSSEEDDISPLEYARFNGLSYNYLDEPAAFIHAGILQKRAEASLSDDSHLQTFDLGREIKIEERLTVSRGGAQLLASVSNGEAPESINSLVLPLLDSRTAKEIKLELPLLKSEHEVDCRDFARRHGFEVKLRDIKLPLEMVDEKNGEGLNLSSKLWSLGTKVLEELKLEKIAVSKDTLGYLQTTIKNVWTPEDDNKLWNSEQRYKRVSSPLLPSYVKFLLTLTSEHCLGPSYTTLVPDAYSTAAIRASIVLSGIPSPNSFRPSISHNRRPQSHRTEDI